MYSQNIGNDFEAVTPTPQNSGKYRTKGSGNLNDNLNWEFTDNGTWIDVASAPDNNGRGVEIEAGHEMTINANASLSAVILKPGAKLTLNDGQTFAPGTFVLESNATATATFVDKRTHANKTDITATVQQHLPILLPVHGGIWPVRLPEQPLQYSAATKWVITAKQTVRIQARLQRQLHLPPEKVMWLR